MNKHDRMYERIEKHGKQLQAIFNVEGDPVKLYKQLRRIETALNRYATYWCNGTNNLAGLDYAIKRGLSTSGYEYGEEEFDRDSKPLIKRLDKILNYTAQGIPVEINTDPRGYALKIDDKYMRAHNIALYRDWGGYGIIAPDFREEG